MKTKMLLLAIFVSVVTVGCVYAWDRNDTIERLSGNKSNIGSYGYNNAATYQAYARINRANQPKSWWESLIDKEKGKKSVKAEEQAITKGRPSPKKTSAAISNSNKVKEEAAVEIKAAVQAAQEETPSHSAEAWNKHREGIELNGNGDNIVIGSIDVPSLDSYTVCIWFKKGLTEGKSDLGTSYGEKIVDKTDLGQGFYIGMGESGEVLFSTSADNGPAGSSICASDKDYRDEKWHQIIVTVSGNYGELWVDGKLKGTGDNLIKSSNNKPLVLGYSYSSDGHQRQYFSGAIDEFAAFNRFFTADNIKDYRKDGPDLSDKNMVAFYSKSGKMFGEFGSTYTTANMTTAKMGDEFTFNFCRPFAESQELLANHRADYFYMVGDTIYMRDAAYWQHYGRGDYGYPGPSIRKTIEVATGGGTLSFNCTRYGQYNYMYMIVDGAWSRILGPNENSKSVSISLSAGSHTISWYTYGSEIHDYTGYATIGKLIVTNSIKKE